MKGSLLKKKISVEHRNSVEHRINKFYIKYYMIKAGNDSIKLKKELSDISNELSKDLIKYLKLN